MSFTFFARPGPGRDVGELRLVGTLTSCPACQFPRIPSAGARAGGLSQRVSSWSPKLEQGKPFSFTASAWPRRLSRAPPERMDLPASKGLRCAHCSPRLPSVSFTCLSHRETRSYSPEAARWLQPGLSQTQPEPRQSAWSHSSWFPDPDCEKKCSNDF